MSSNQPRRGRGREPGPRGRGRGREVDDEECAPYLKKVRHTTVGDALRKSSSSSGEGQQARCQRQLTGAAMPRNQPGRGWGVGGGGRGRGREGDLDEGTADSEKGLQPTLPEHDWPSLPSSSSSESTPTMPETRLKAGANADTTDPKKGCLREMKPGGMNRSSPSSSSDSTPQSSQLAGVVTNSQTGHLRDGKHAEDYAKRPPSNKSSPSSGDCTPRSTAPREKEIVRQPTPSSSSDATPPSNQLKKSEGSSGGKLSYLSIFEKGSDPDKLKRLSSKLTMFLHNFKEDGATFPYYIAELAAIKLRSPFNITIMFKHIIEYDVQLAFETWKLQGNMQDWILPAVRNFLRLHKYGSENEIMSKTRLTLSGYPSSMRRVVDVLKDATYSLELLGGESRVCEAKSDGKLVVTLFFTAIFSRHLKDMSYDGNFSASDMWLVNNVELRICRPCMSATGPRRLRDLQKGGEELLPYFKGPAGYPVYFAQLEEDIRETNINQIVEAWCVEYFTFHMASLPSMTRRNFELALHYITKNIAIELEGVFAMLSSELVTNWLEYIEKSECQLLKDVLNYTDPATGMKVKYENTIGGLVKYKRHFLEHVLFGHIFDINEVELFGAKKFSKHLPGAVKLLLQRKKMVTCFGAAWSSLKNSRFDSRDTPVKGL